MTAKTGQRTDAERIRQMVRRVVFRTLGVSGPSQRTAGTTLVTGQDLERVPEGGEFTVPTDALITPLARQAAMERKISLVSGAVPEAPHTATPSSGAAAGNTVAIGADHAGFDLKQFLKAQLRQQGYAVIDCGTDSAESVDYPDFALAVAQLVSRGRAWRGIVVDGAGIGSCMVANKVAGVRAAMCYDEPTAINSRAHNDANVLTLGAGMIRPELARRIVQVWLATSAEGGRHARRVGKITDIERQFSRTR